MTAERFSVWRDASTILWAGTLCLLWSVCGAQEMPVDLAHLRDRAEEHYFDGDYDDALRVLNEAEKWLDSSLNKRDIARFGFDHSMLDAVFSGFRAEVLFALGEPRKAAGALKHAEKTLKNRRARYVASGLLPPMLWQYEAFIGFVGGDLTQPVPDFGLAGDPKLPESVRAVLADRGSPSKAMADYRDAEAVLGDPRAPDGGEFFRRLEGRLLTSLARCCLVKAGPPTPNERTDARAFLDRAEAVLSQGEFWQRIINVGDSTALPLTFEEVRQQNADPAQRLGLKRRFNQTIGDWVKIHTLQSELTAYAGDTSEGEEEHEGPVGEAGRRYDEIMEFVKSQFGAEHASVQRVQLSRARWNYALARSPEGAAEIRFSRLQACLEDVGGIAKLPAGEVTQARLLELAASGILLDVDRGLNKLAAEDREKLEAKVEALQGSLSTLVGR